MSNVAPVVPQVHLSARTLAAMVGLWAVLSVMAEGENTRGLAVALAWTVALTSALALGPQAISNGRHLVPEIFGE